MLIEKYGRPKRYTYLMKVQHIELRRPAVFNPFSLSEYLNFQLVDTMYVVNVEYTDFGYWYILLLSFINMYSLL